jgi:lipoyl(octanoyl) transferase
MASGAAGQRGGGAVTATAAHGEILRCAQDDSVARLPRWHLWLDETPRPGWANMAIDHALLERTEHHGESWLRLYRWDPPCLSFGRHEPATRRYDADRIEELGLDTVRRPTGGRAVWHSRELTYAVTSPYLHFGSLKAAYLEIHRMLGDALARLGVSVSIAPPARAAPLDAGACFAQPAGGEVLVGGRKVVGSAQYRQGAALLQHGSILLDDEQRIVVSLTRGGRLEASWSGSERTVAPPLTDGRGRPLHSQEIAESIARSAALRWPASWERVQVPDPVLEAAPRHYPHYRSAAWTWAR